MRRIAIAFVATLGLIAGTSAGFAGTLSDRFSSFFVFGDSLSDPGNTPLGRFTDGRVWAQELSDDFTAPGSTANFAVGGGRAIGPDDNDLDAQLNNFAGAVGGGFVKLGVRPLAAIWFGGNDVFSAIFSGQGVINPAAAAQKVVGTISGLFDTYGIRDFIVFDLPDQGNSPLARAFGVETLLSGRSNDFNTALRAGLNGLAPQISDNRVPISKLFDQAAGDPSALGLASLTIPCHTGLTPIPDRAVCTTPGIEGLPASLFGFNDPVHPNSVLHGEIAKQARLAAIPLPASAPLLLAAGGFLVLMRRRRTA